MSLARRSAIALANAGSLAKATPRNNRGMEIKVRLATIIPVDFILKRWGFFGARSTVNTAKVKLRINQFFSTDPRVSRRTIIVYRRNLFRELFWSNFGVFHYQRKQTYKVTTFCAKKSHRLRLSLLRRDHEGLFRRHLPLLRAGRERSALSPRGVRVSCVRE